MGKLQKNYILNVNLGTKLTFYLKFWITSLIGFPEGVPPISDLFVTAAKMYLKVGMTHFYINFYTRCHTECVVPISKYI